MIIDLGSIGKIVASVAVCVLIIACIVAGFKTDKEVNGNGNTSSEAKPSNSDDKKESK